VTCRLTPTVGENVRVNPSEVLGVRPGAPPAEVRRAFAEAVRTAHPDTGGSPADAGRRMAELVAARDELLSGRAARPPRPPGRAPVTIYHRATGLERLVGLFTAALLGRGDTEEERHLR
jgi:hypothetical protein